MILRKWKDRLGTVLLSQIALGPLLVGKGKQKIALHVGAHRAEERRFYQRLGFSRVDWIEGQPELAHELKQTLPSERNRVFQACVWGTSGLSMELPNQEAQTGEFRT